MLSIPLFSIFSTSVRSNVDIISSAHYPISSGSDQPMGSEGQAARPAVRTLCIALQLIPSIHTFAFGWNGDFLFQLPVIALDL